MSETPKNHAPSPPAPNAGAQPPFHDFGAIALIILLGLQAMIVQIILIRESLVIFQGNELCFGVVFAAWLLGIALGANVGARFAEKADRGDLLTLLLIMVMALLPLAQVYLIRVQRVWLHVPPGELAPFTSLLVSSLLTITPFSATVGYVFPFAYQLFKRWAENPAAAIGRLYIVEANGSILGGILFTFYIAGRLDAFTVLSITGITLCLFVVTYAGEGADDPVGEQVRVGGVYVVALLGACLLGGLMTQKHYETVLARWRSFNANLTYASSFDSRYENLLIARKGKQFSVFGNGQYLFSFPDDPTCAEQAGRVLTEHPNPKNVLLIGGGVGGLLRQMLLHPIARLDYVELDPALVRLARKFLPEADRAALADERVCLHYEDGRYFLRRAPQIYDLVFVNLPDPSTAMINRFYTREFFVQVKHALKPDGVLATRISSAVGYLGEEVGSYATSLQRTLSSVFVEVIVSPGDVNYFFACDTPGIVTHNLPTLMKRYKERNIKTKYFSEHMFATLLQPEQVENLANQLAARRGVPLNTDFRPVTYFYNLMLWDQFAGRQLAGFYRWVRRAQLWWIVALLAALFALRLAYVLLTPRRSDLHRRFNVLLVIFATGFAGLSWELLLIFSFQNTYGYVYERVGLIIAVFMIGLAIGGACTNRPKKEGLAPASRLAGACPLFSDLSLLATLTLANILYACLLPLILSLLARNPLTLKWIEAPSAVLMTLTVFAGFLTGAPFPLAGRLHLALAGKTGRAAGLVDSLDNLGAFIGALFTGVLLIPLLGVVNTSLAIALLNLAALGLLLIRRRPVDH